MAQLIDSSVFITLERRDLTLDDLSAIGAKEPFAMSSVSASELLVGVPFPAMAFEVMRFATALQYFADGEADKVREFHDGL